MFINSSGIYIVFGFLFIWLFILTFLLFKTKKHYHRLISSAKKKTIEEILEKLMNDDLKFEKEIDKIKKEISKIELSSRLYFQKLGIVRFNPFERIGGEQSFVMAILNKEDSGVVINFIYTREGMRAYLKRVKNGHGIEYNLSGEENEAIKKANSDPNLRIHSNSTNYSDHSDSN